ncbi:MAG: NADH-quinone oxidoreductase subunit C [Planctomycetes bacterium]|nr:NADH-quinone oxidoreductase subunit C [Planctomycetota bacterium]
MTAGATAPRFAPALAGLEHRLVDSGDGMPTIEVARERLHELLARLRDRAGFGMCTLVTAVDHLPAEPRFQVTHQLLSLEHRDRVRVHCRVPGNDPWVPSCVDLWPGANWSERECWDMFGVRFAGHPDLRRLLMPEEYDHHPLRKDFPQGGIEPDRLYREWDRKRRAGWSEPR